MWSSTSWLSRSIHTGQMVQVMPENICTNPQQMLMLRMTLILTLEEDWISAPTCELLRSESSLSLKRWRNEIEMKVKTIQREKLFCCLYVQIKSSNWVCVFSKVTTWPSFCILVALRPSLPSKGIAICNFERRLDTFIANYTKSTRWMSILVRTGLSKNNVSFSLTTITSHWHFYSVEIFNPTLVFFCINVFTLVFWL